MINVQIVGDSAVVARLNSMSAKTENAVRETIGRLALRLQRKVQQEKLTGQALKVRTGTLRRSIGLATLSENGAITGVVSTNLKYARAHEYGFHGAVTVKAHLRKITQAFGKKLKTPKQVMVSSHAMKMNLPERSFLRTSLREIEPLVIPNLKAALREATK
jgi:phage gpG-like protein